MGRTVKGVIFVALVIVVALTMMIVLQRRLIYFPSASVPDLNTVLPGAEEVTLSTDDDLALSAWLVPPSVTANGGTVVVFNGNAGNRAGRIPLAEALVGHGYAVLLFDYRGYGGNPGSPTEDGLVLDARAAVTFLEGRPEVDAERLAYFGESLGAAVAIALAEQRPPAALVLRSPFTSLSDVGSFHYPFLPVSALLWDRYPNLEKIRRVESPILVVAGSADTVVPLTQTCTLFEQALEPKQLVQIEGADHNDLELLAGPQLVAAVVDFLEQAMLSGTD